MYSEIQIASDFILKFGTLVLRFPLIFRNLVYSEYSGTQKEAQGAVIGRTNKLWDCTQTSRLPLIIFNLN